MILFARLLITLSLVVSCLHAHADVAACNMRMETKFGTMIVDDPEAVLLLQDQRAIAEAMKLHGAERKAALKTYFTQRAVTNSQVGATFFNYAAAIYMGVRIAIGMHGDPSSEMRALLELPPTLLTADMMSGFLHVFLDKYASETNPIWGNAARAFRIHHEYMSNLNDLSYVDNVAPFGRLLTPLYVLGAFAAPHMAPDMATSMLLGLLLFTNGSEIHRQAHLPKPNIIAGWLQKIRVFLNKEDHNAHHHDDHNHDFGIINGWSNRLMPGKLFEYVDRAYYKATRKLPRNWIQHPESMPDSVLEDLANDLDSIPQSLFVSALEPGNGDDRVEELMRLWMEAHPENVDTSGGDNAPNP